MRFCWLRSRTGKSMRRRSNDYKQDEAEATRKADKAEAPAMRGTLEGTEPLLLPLRRYGVRARYRYRCRGHPTEVDEGEFLSMISTSIIFYLQQVSFVHFIHCFC